jgi:hypothetical protein
VWGGVGKGRTGERDVGAWNNLVFAVVLSADQE